MEADGGGELLGIEIERGSEFFSGTDGEPFHCHDAGYIISPDSGLQV